MAEPPAVRLARDFDQAWGWFAQDGVLQEAIVPSGERPYLVWLVRVPLTPGVHRLRDLLGSRPWQLPDEWLHMTVQEVGFVDPPAEAPPPPSRSMSLGPPNVLWGSVVLEVHSSGLDRPFKLPHVSVLYADHTGPDPKLRQLLARARQDWEPDALTTDAMELVAVDVSRRFGPWTTLRRVQIRG